MLFYILLCYLCYSIFYYATLYMSNKRPVTEYFIPHRKCCTQVLRQTGQRRISKCETGTQYGG